MYKTLVAVVVFTILSACGGPSVEERYLTQLREAGLTAPDEILLAQGHQICTELDNGKTLNQLIFEESMTILFSSPDNFFSGPSNDEAEKAGALIGTAVAAFCPEHIPAGWS